MFEGSETCRAGPWMAGVGILSSDASPVGKVKSRGVERVPIGVLRAVFTSGITKTPFDRSVFQRVKRDDGQSCSWREKVDGRIKAIFELFNLAIDCHPKRLKASSSWMVSTVAVSGSCSDAVGERACAGPGSTFDDGSGDLLGPGFFTVAA